MTNIHVLENRISLIKSFLVTLKRYKKYSIEEIEKDLDIRGALERYLYLAMQATIDLAEAFISYKEFRKPTSMRESFSILQEQELISMELTNNLIAMVGFRNVIAHGYDRIDYKKVHKAVHEDMKHLVEFMTVIEKLL